MSSTLRTLRKLIEPNEAISDKKKLGTCSHPEIVIEISETSWQLRHLPYLQTCIGLLNVSFVAT